MIGRHRIADIAGATLCGALLSAPTAMATVSDPGDSGTFTLRGQIAAAPSGGVVQIAPGVNPTLTSGQILIDKDLTIEGQGMNSTTISVPSHNSRVFGIGSSVSHPLVTLQDLEITGGKPTPSAPPNNGGGAILSRGELSLNHVAIVGNNAAPGANGANGSAGGAGGGIAMVGTLVPAMSVSNSVFSDNLAGAGGQITGATGTGGAGGSGGAIELDGSSAKITDTTITGNSAGNGGAVPAAATPGDAGEGGGIDAPLGDVKLYRSTLDDNSAGDAGPGGNVLVDGGDGGGILGLTKVVNSTIAHNQAGDGGGTGDGGDGGGIESFGGYVISSTLTGNRVGQGIHSGTGAALAAGGPLDVSSSIVDTAGDSCAGAVSDAGHNLGDDTSCPAGFLDASPGFSPAGLAYNGGPTKTIALAPGSLAIDAVPAASCVDDGTPTPAPLTIDQRGLARPAGSACDIGAYEAQPSADVPPNIAAAPVAPGAPAVSPATNKCKRGKKKHHAVTAKKKCKRRKK